VSEAPSPLSVAVARRSPRTPRDIYVWTDDSGKTHLADSVPEKYRKSAVRIDSSQFEPTPEQQREAAAARAALEKKASAVSAPRPAAARTTPACPVRRAARRAHRAAVGERMRRLQREYRESLECFAPYVNANGSLKPGAFRRAGRSSTRR
jgi:hypothetical protein